MKKSTLSLIACFLVFGFFTPVFAGKNLLRNPSFEDGLSGWYTTSWNTQVGACIFKVNKGRAHSGNICVSIENIQNNDSRLVQTVKVVEGKKYRFAAWIRTENVGIGAKGACVSFVGRLETSRDIKGTNGKWELSEMYVSIGKGIKTIDVALCLGGYNSINRGKAFFDDASFTEVDRIPEGAVTAEISRQEDNPVQTGKKQVDREKVVWKVFLSGLLLTSVAFYFAFKDTKAGQSLSVRKGKR